MAYPSNGLTDQKKQRKKCLTFSDGGKGRGDHWGTI